MNLNPFSLFFAQPEGQAVEKAYKTSVSIKIVRSCMAFVACYPHSLRFLVQERGREKARLGTERYRNKVNRSLSASF